MNVIFMGTPQFAATALEKLYKAGHNISLVISQPDRAKDRGKKMQPSEVKAKAIELGLPVETPDHVRDIEATIKSLNADLIVVAAYGQILPKSILESAKYGSVNLHASLLPKYRGAAPIQRVIMDGEEETGVSLMYMAEKLDCGDVIAVVKTPVGRKTTDELFSELANLGAELLIEEMKDIDSWQVKKIPQDDSKASYAKMVFKNEAEINWTGSAKTADCLVRALPAWTKLGETVLKIHGAYPTDKKCSQAPGTVISSDKNGIEVACGDGSLVIKTIQAPGKKAMDVSAFLLGNRIDIGSVLG